MKAVVVAMLAGLVACGGDGESSVQPGSASNAAKDGVPTDPLEANMSGFAAAHAALATMPPVTTPQRIPVPIRTLTQNIVLLRDDHLAALARGDRLAAVAADTALGFPAAPPSALRRVDTLVVVRGTYRAAQPSPPDARRPGFTPAWFSGDVTVFELPSGSYVGGFAVTGMSKAQADPAAPEADNITRLNDELVLNVGAGVLRGLALFSGDTASAAGRKTGKTVVLTHLGDNKLEVVKALRASGDMALKQAYQLTGSIPAIVTTGATDGQADALVQSLRAAGATAQLL